MNQSHVARRKYHFIYKTVCLLTNKYYYGRHSTDNLEDGYLGSGTYFTKSVRKYGRENHIRNIIEYLPDLALLKLREAEIVNREILKDEMCMNLALGGSGGNEDGWGYVNKFRSPEKWKQIQKLGWHAMHNAMTAEKRSAISKSNYANSPVMQANALVFGKVNQPLAVIAAASPEANAKRKTTMAMNNHSKGEKNSQHNTCWVNKDSKALKVDRLNLQSYLEQGYFEGRVFKEQVSVKKRSNKVEESYKALKPVCRNNECRAELLLQAFRKGRTSCSKACSNKTRIFTNA